MSDKNIVSVWLSALLYSSQSVSSLPRYRESYLNLRVKYEFKDKSFHTKNNNCKLRRLLTYLPINQVGTYL